MSIKELLEQLRQRGVSLGLNNGKLKLVDPNNNMSAELMQALKLNKDAIIELMTKGKRFTQADFPLANLDNAALADLQRRYPHMEKVMVTTPMQQGLLFHSVLDDSAYISNTYCKFNGELNLPLFKQAWQEMINRHEIYRTCFTGFEHEHIHQLVLSKATLNFDYQDWRELNRKEQVTAINRFHAQDMKSGFKLEAAPLFRLALVRLSEQQYHFSWTRHHVISDGWCSSIVFAEVLEIYQALLQNCSPRLQPAAPLDAYIEWLAVQDREEATKYWKTQLTDVSHTSMFGIEGHQVTNIEAGHLEKRFTLPDATLNNLLQLGKKQQTTLNVLVQAAWSYLLHLYSGETTVVVGSTISGRPPELPDVERMIGIFINTVPVVSRFSPELTIEELLSSLHEANIHSGEYGYLSLAEVQKCSDLNEGSLFNNIIVFDNYPVEDALAGDDTEASIGMRISDIGAHSQNNFDISLTASFTDVLALRLLYNNCRFSDGQIIEIQQRFLQILDRLSSYTSNALVSTLYHLDERELQDLVALGKGADNLSGRESNILVSINKTAKVHPDRLAVDDGNCSLTYAQLDSKVCKLAAFLQEQGIEQGERVGVYFKRTTEMLIATLAIMKTGASYVMLEPRNSTQRLLHIVGDAGLEIVLVQSSLMANLPLQGIDVITIEDHVESDWLEGYEDGFEATDIASNSEAYVIYTSGSTGVPKGVSVLHKGLADYCAFGSQHYYTPRLDGSLVITSHGFDISIPSLFIPLLRGGSVYLLPWDDEISAAVEKLQATQSPLLVRLTPLHAAALLDMLPDDSECAVAHVFVIGGEQLTFELVARLKRYFPNSTFYNHYGPSETVVGCAIFHITDYTHTGSVPIGRPMENTSLLVLDEFGKPVSRGMVGELHVSGTCVANGYLNLAELTSQKFIDNPFGTGEFSKMYKTGDVVRFNEDGDLVYLGRTDDQIKLRGFRIELGDIISSLLLEDEVENAVVILKDQRLLAYVVTEANQLDSLESEEALALSQSLKARLTDNLPDYMVPDSIILLSELPLTANGKLDKRALPEQREKKECVGPRNDIEERLYNIWTQVLKHKEVGIFESFFERGGHSILATRLVSLIRKEFHCEIALKTLFEQPTIAALASIVATGSEESKAKFPDLLPTTKAKQCLSYAQQRLFFIDHLENGSAQFNMSGMLQIRGNTNSDALECALRTIIERHQILRTTFHAVDSEVRLKISDDCTPNISYRTLNNITEDEQNFHIQKIAREKSLIPFDLSQDKLFRVELVTLSENHAVAIFNMHHIASDGWSMGILINEFCSLYQSYCRNEATSLPEMFIQYSDFAHWQQSLLSSEAAKEEMQYWKQQLHDLPIVHSLPLDNPRSAKQVFSGAVEVQTLSADLLKKIDEVCQEQGVTRFMFLETVFSLLLSRFGNSNDIVIGTPIAGRLHQNTEKLIGCFVNSLVLRTQIKSDETFADLLQRNKQTIIDAFDNQTIPFDLLVDELNPVRNLSHDPVFQVVFSLNNTDTYELILDDLEIRELSQPQTTSKSELEVSARELASGELAIRWIYRDKLFNRESINALKDAYLALIENTLNEVSLLSGAIPLVSKAKREQLIVQGTGPLHALSSTRHFADIVENQARYSSNEKAVEFNDKSISYKTLNEKANLLADCLLDSGVVPGDRVGIYLERRPEVLLAILAIGKIGASYVALEPDHPASRIEYIIRDAEIELILTRSVLLERIKLNMVDVLVLDDSLEESQWLIEFNGENPCRKHLPDNREMYVLYTSGTTGKPKGVEIASSGVVNYLDYANRHYHLTELTASIVSSPLCFDATVTTLLTPLTAGRPIRILNTDRDIIEQLEKYLFDKENSYLFKLTPSHLNALAAIKDDGDSCNSKHVIVVGGEQLKQKTLKNWQTILPNTTFVNEYGPTETVVGCSTYFAVPSSEPAGENVPIGRPISNTQLYVLDQNQAIVPSLFQGELYIGGAGVALGYANNEKLSQEKFVTNPLSSDENSMLYRTGDVVRWLDDGTLEFLGRNDDQIKLNGYRIELSEIERQLLESSDVEKVVVIKVTEPTEKLVAYIVHTNSEICADASKAYECTTKLQSYLRAQLPNYMVPSQFIFIDTVPLTTNGKVDVKALPQASGENLNKQDYVKASNEIEALLSDIWKDLLSVETVGIDDNYFALGGDSIVSIQIVSRARKQRLHFTVRDIFNNQTIRTLALVVESEARFDAQQDVVSGEMTLLPIQLRFVKSTIPDKHHFNQSVLLSASEQVNEKLIKPIVSAIYQRHDALRLRLTTDGKVGHFTPISEELLADSVRLFDLSTLPENERIPALSAECKQLQADFNLERGSLFRVVYFHLGGTQKRLFIVAHHLIVDAVSWRILLKDFEHAYEQVTSGKKISLDNKTSSIQQWASALEDFAGSEVINAEREYWVKQLAKPYARLTFESNNAARSCRNVITAHLTESETTTLISEVSQVYRTEVNEFLLSALAIAVRNWTHQSIVRVELEGHGREELFDTLDVTETVGWFTSLYPMILDISSDYGEGEVIKSIKEQYRMLPHHGIGYGLLKELQEDQQLNELDSLEQSQRIYFNYLGQFDSTLQEKGAFSPAIEERGLSFSEKQSLQSLANLTAAVSEGQFQFSITFNPTCLPEEQANRFLTEYMDALRGCLLHCSTIDLASPLPISEIENQSEEDREEFLI